MASPAAKTRRNKVWKANRKRKKLAKEAGKPEQPKTVKAARPPAIGDGDGLKQSSSEAIERRAMREGWATPDEWKPKLVNRQLVIAGDPTKPDLEVIKSFVALERADAREREFAIRERELELRKQEVETHRKEMEARIVAQFKAPEQVPAGTNVNIQLNQIAGQVAADHPPAETVKVDPSAYLNPNIRDQYDRFLSALDGESGSPNDGEVDAGGLSEVSDAE